MERTSRVEYLSRKPKSTKPSVSGEGSSSAMRKRSPTRHRSSGRRSPLGSDSHKARIGTAFGRDSPTKRRSSNRKSPSRSDHEVNPFDNLPNELLQHILSYDDLRSLNINQVSKRFNDNVRQVKVFKLKNTTSLNDIERMSKKIQGIS